MMVMARKRTLPCARNKEGATDIPRTSKTCRTGMPTDAVRQKENWFSGFHYSILFTHPCQFTTKRTDRQETHTSRAFTLHRPPESYV